MLEKIWEALVRLRTWLFNGVLALLVIAPEILNAPEVLAVVPQEWQRWFLAALFLINIWMRPRPAVMKKDPEVQVKKLADHFEGA